MKKLGLPLGLVAIVAVLIGLFIIGNKSTPAKKDNAKRLGTTHANQGQTHIQPGTPHETYNSNPPTSGSHYPQPATWGIKDSALPDEQLVHNLEHGGINIFYKPDLPKDQIAKLKQIYNKLPVSQQFNSVKAILAPRAANKNPIELTAWTYSHSLTTPDEAKILQFYNDHLDKGPELVP